ncbi:basic amino acid ABC transporter substrate-binding protein [Salirhabdus salicampi]|uniref:basic amino acid ABC transporter substrate-binding protein n=1 Tax=Salirhabdus salicampi TaxID=476102 RepID=UPI0020C1BF02|nr:basic amino acid ABC transporter substrate-binding protein [Salirhabdus salicampi]MCP8615445.1 basic amino acid ABC transporter substrate-binding protein [Salirhabdus salicampi]
MKKSFLLIFASLILVLAACGTSENGENDGQGSDGGDEKEKLRVVTDAAYAPFEYMDKGEIVGFDVDFITAVLEEAGYEFTIENVGWDPLFVEIKDEHADFAISAITINDDRKETYDFSVPYFESRNMILVPTDSDIESGDDLKGKKVAVQNGTTGQEVVEEILGTNNKNISKFENNNLAIQELLAGGADAVVADNTVVLEYVKNNPDKDLKTVEDPNFESEFYGLMFPKGSELQEDINEAVKTVIENGTYAEIFEEWFGKAPNVDALIDQQ